MEMAAVHDKLSNQARFILAVIAGKLTISKRKKADVVMDMRKMEFKPIPKVAKKPDTSNEPEGDEEEELHDASAAEVGRDTGQPVFKLVECYPTTDCKSPQTLITA